MTKIGKNLGYRMEKYRLNLSFSRQSSKLQEKTPALHEEDTALQNKNFISFFLDRHFDHSENRPREPIKS
jgi:hypothetical protein